MKPSWLIGRIGQHAFNVVLSNRDRRGDEQSDAANYRDHQQRFGREQRIDAANEENAGSDHRCRMDERRNRRRAFHRVGQPHVQRELGTFANTAAENSDSGNEQNPMAQLGPLGPQSSDFSGSFTAAVLAPIADDVGNLIASLERNHPIGRRELKVVFAAKLAENAGPKAAIVVFHVAKVKRANRRSRSPSGRSAFRSRRRD